MAKYVVRKDGPLTKLYAITFRDGTVFWNPQRNKASEMSLERATALANRRAGSEVVCADCDGNCDNILDALKVALQEQVAC